MNRRFKSLLKALAVVVSFDLVIVFVFGGEPMGAQGALLLAFIAAWAAEGQPELLEG